MPKRFTDTEKWSRPWFRTLPNPYKLLWIYILDNCDMAGVWYVDFELASFKIKSEINQAEALVLLEKQIIPLSDGTRWLVKDFISFQYGNLNGKTSRVHGGVLSVVEKHGLTYNADSLSIAYPYPIDSPKDKDKDKDKAKALEKDKAKVKATDKAIC